MDKCPFACGELAVKLGVCKRHYLQAYSAGLTVAAFSMVWTDVCALCGGRATELDHDHSCCHRSRSARPSRHLGVEVPSRFAQRRCGRCNRGFLCSSCNRDVSAVERGFGSRLPLSHESAILDYLEMHA